MSDFFSNLIARSYADNPAVRPRLPSLFESGSAGETSEVQSSTPLTSAAKPSTKEISPSENAPPKIEPSTGKINSVAKNYPLEEPSQSSLPSAPTSLFQPVPHLEQSTAAHFISDSPAQPPAAKKTIPVIASAAGKTQGRNAGSLHNDGLSTRSNVPKRRQNDFLAAESRPSAPTINVTIGRVEVRAIQSAAPAPKAAKPASPKLSLDDYLQKGGGPAR